MELATADMEQNQLAAEAIDIIKKTWKKLLQEAQVSDRNAPLETGKLDR